MFSPYTYYWRAACGLRTLRYVEAAKVDYRYFEREYGIDAPRIPKFRGIPSEIQESNYGEERFSIIKYDRWVMVRDKKIETRRKLHRLACRRKDRQYRVQEKRNGFSFEE